MKQTKIKQKSVNFQKPVSKKKHTNLYQICFLIVSIYIVEAKKGCKKKV